MLCFLTIIDTEEGRSRFEEIYRDYRNLIYFCANRILKNSFDAEDASQNTFLYIAQHIDRFRDISEKDCKGLVLMVATQKSLDLYRKLSKNSGVSLEQQESVGIEASDPVSHTDRIDEDLSGILGQMDPRYREVLLKRLCYGYEFSDIARELMITETYARKILQRARQQFIRLYEERGQSA